MTFATRVRNRTRAGVIAVLALGLVGLVVAIAFTVNDKAQRLAGTNDVAPAQPAKVAGPSKTVCQADPLYSDTAAVRVLALTNGQPTPALAVWANVGPSPRFMQGQLPAGWHEGWIVIPTQRVAHEVPNATVCFQNRGANTVSIMGWNGAARFEFLRPGKESWASLAPAIVSRFGLVKAGWEGSWTVWLVGFLVVLAAAIAGWAVIGTARE